MQRAGLTVLSLLMTLVLIAVALEVFVRFFVDNGMQYDIEMWKYARHGKHVSANPKIGHEHVPGAHFKVMGVDVSINKHGLRNQPTTLEKKPGIFRILMLGDSLTFGWGVPYEDTYSHLLEKRLQSAGINAEVLNSGIGNTNTVMQVERFLTSTQRFHPDLVILNYFINDAEDIPSYSKTSLLSRFSYAWTYFGSRIDVLMRQLSARKDWMDYYRALYGPDGHWKEASQAIDKLAAFCAERGIRLVVANYPELRVVKDYPFSDISGEVQKAAERNQLPYLDLLDSVRNEDPSSLWISVPDPHPNSHANHLFAGALFAWLEKNGLIPAATARTPTAN